MIGITRTKEPWGTKLTVDGDLKGEEAARVLESSCRAANVNDTLVIVFLRNVTEVDEGAQQVLRRLAAEGVSLAGRGVDAEHLVQELYAQKA